ncbi:MAG TPA: sulfite exporter TauE/SafE family protein [Acidimicrobiia bacterium]
MHRSLQAGLLGLAAGFVGGLVGIGGGLVMVPGLVLFLSLDQHRAHATSTAVIVVATSASVLPFVLNSEVAWATGGWLLVGSVIGAYAGARFFMRIPAVWLARAFVVRAVVSAARLALT